MLVDICPEDKDRYRFGFNGQEKVNEWAGIGNYLDFGERGEDTRIARFLSIDPLNEKFPWYTPYQFAGNNPIENLDLDGLEQLNFRDHLALNGGQASGAVVSFIADWFTSPFVKLTNATTANARNIEQHHTQSGYTEYVPEQVRQIREGSINNATKTEMVKSVVQVYENTTTVMGVLMGQYESTLALPANIVPKEVVWKTTTDRNFVGSLATRLGKVVQGVDEAFTFSGGSGDVDIVTATMNIEVKSGNKMKLTQSLKNMEYAKSKGKEFGLYMPKATKIQTFDAQKKGVNVYKTEKELMDAINHTKSK